MRYILIIITLIPTICSKSYADQWIDPEFDEMIDSSIAIVLGEVIHEGSNYAEVKILKKFKGNITLDTIIVSGMSNRYGPYDTLYVGERYYFFFDYMLSDTSYFKSINKRINEDKALSYYQDKIRLDNLYFVWTPTSGDILVDKDGVHADLVYNRSYKGFNDPLTVEYFEKLLNIRIYKIADRSFNRKIFKKFSSTYENGEYPITLQYYSMLYLINSDIYSDVIETAAQDTFYLTRFITARYLKNVNQKRARDVLVNMLDDIDPLVQSEAIRSFKYFDPSIAGPILLSKLNDVSSDETSFSSGIMDPVIHVYDSSFEEMLKAFSYMKYKPALPELLKLLESIDDYYLFDDLLDAIYEIDSISVIPFFINYLQPGKEPHSYKRLSQVVNRISSSKFEECKIPLLKLIEAVIDTNQMPHINEDNDLLISPEYISVFNDEVTREVLRNGFKELISRKDKLHLDSYEDWIETFVDAFREFNIHEAKDEVYSLIYFDSVTSDKDSIIILYQDLGEIYSDLVSFIDSILKNEAIPDKNLYISNLYFINPSLYDLDDYIINLYCYLDDFVYGFDRLTMESAPDTLKIKFDKINEKFILVTNCSNYEYHIGALGIFFEQLCYEPQEIDYPYLLSVLEYYIKFPDKENYLNMIYLNNKYLSGRFVPQLLKIGEEFYPTY